MQCVARGSVSVARRIVNTATSPRQTHSAAAAAAAAPIATACTAGAAAGGAAEATRGNGRMAVAATSPVLKHMGVRSIATSAATLSPPASSAATITTTPLHANSASGSGSGPDAASGTATDASASADAPAARRRPLRVEVVDLDKDFDRIMAGASRPAAAAPANAWTADVFAHQTRSADLKHTSAAAGLGFGKHSECLECLGCREFALEGEAV